MPRAKATYVNPLAIAQTLDYLSLTLAVDPRWTHNRPLIKGVDLRSAGTLSLPVVNEVEFRDHLSALAQVLEHLDVPHVDPENQGKEGSLSRLDSWTQANLKDPADQASAREAIQDLRDVVRQRVASQHAGSSLKAEAAARVRLGMPEVVYDWPDAWKQVEARVVEAFETIRIAVRGSRPDP